MFCIDYLKPNNIYSVEKLLDDCFGEDRQSKTAYRLREDRAPIAELSFVVHLGEVLVASLQFWQIEVRKSNGTIYEALLLGPIAVSADRRGEGIGLMLMRHGLAQARDLGHQRVILVGDEDYYCKVGFSRALATGLRMPGPVDAQRLLAQELVPGAMRGVEGLLSKIK